MALPVISNVFFIRGFDPMFAEFYYLLFDEIRELMKD